MSYLETPGVGAGGSKIGKRNAVRIPHVRTPAMLQKACHHCLATRSSNCIANKAQVVKEQRPS